MTPGGEGINNCEEGSGDAAPSYVEEEAEEAAPSYVEEEAAAAPSYVEEETAEAPPVEEVRWGSGSWQPSAPRSRVPDYVQASAPRGGWRVHFAELLVATMHGPHPRIRDGSEVIQMAEEMSTSPSIETYVRDVLIRCRY